MLWDHFRQADICVIGIPRGGKEVTEKLFEELLVEAFPNYDENCKPAEPRNTMNPKNKKYDHHNQIAEKQ